MKKYSLIILILFTLSCAQNRYVGFKSASNISNNTYINHSSLHLINISNEMKKELIDDYSILELGIFAGIDGDSKKYIVIAPSMNESYKWEAFLKYDLSFSTIIRYNELEQLINFTEKSISTWDIPVSEFDGEFFNYKIAPKYMTLHLNDSLDSSFSTFEFNYQATLEGNVVNISLKNLNYYKSVNIFRKIDLEILVTKLKSAKEYLDKYPN